MKYVIVLETINGHQNKGLSQRRISNSKHHPYLKNSLRERERERDSPNTNHMARILQTPWC